MGLDLEELSGENNQNMKIKKIQFIAALIFLLVFSAAIALAVPSVSLTASSGTDVETTAILTAVASDSINKMESLIFYKDENEIKTKDCLSRTSCSDSLIDVETNATSHEYQVKAISKDGNEAWSNKITITFEGFTYKEPYWTSYNHTPQPPATYDPNQEYSFFSDWILSAWNSSSTKEYIFFESNISGNMENYSTTRDVQTYTYTTTGIDAGNYIWRMHATDEVGNKNSTPFINYTILKADPQITLYIDGNTDDITAVKPANITVQGQVNIGESADFNVYDNGDTILQSIQEGGIYTVTLDTSGMHEITLEYLGTNNYNPLNTSLFVNVTDDVAPGPVTDINATNITDHSITLEWTKPSDDDLNHTVLIIYNTSDSIITTQTINNMLETAVFDNLNYNTTYYVSFQTFDNAGNAGDIVNSSDIKTLPDTTDPVITVIALTSPQTYSPNKTYVFEASVEENHLDNVWFDFNGTITQLTSNNSDYIHNITTTGAGNYTYTWFANDTAGNTANESIDLVVEKAIPTCALTFDPTSPAAYGAQINASCSCTNPEANPTLWRNISGTMTDVTASENNQNITLPAGTHNYICNISKTQNYTAANDSADYTITPTNSILNLTIDGNNSDKTVEVLIPVNITGEITTPSTGFLELYDNGILINSGNDILTNITSYDSAGTRNITLKYNGTINATPSSETLFITVTDALPASISNLSSPTKAHDWIYWTWDNPTDLDFNKSIIYINNTEVNRTSNEYYNATGLTENTTYTINIHTKDNNGNINSTDVTDNQTTPFPTTGNVIINEIMYDVSGSDSNHEWIEIYNNDSSRINISNWIFNSDSTNHALNLINGSEIFNSGEYAIITQDSATFLTDYPAFNGILFDSSWVDFSNTNEYLELIDSDTNTIDIVNYSSSWGNDTAGYSLELNYTYMDNNIGANWHTSFEDGGTPGAPNSHPSSVISWNMPSIFIGSGEVGSGEINVSEDIDSIQINNNVSVICNSGDCLIITDNWVDETGMINGETQSVTFTCDDSAAGNFSAIFNLTSEDDPSADKINVTCEMVLPPTFLSGIVTNETTALENATILLEQSGILFNQTSTDASGFYNVSVVYGQIYDVTAYYTGYTNQTKTITMNESKVLDFNMSCVPNWDCTSWSSCSGGTQTRTCTDLNSCGVDTGKPSESKSCTNPRSCFPAGTKILMADNSKKNIEDIEVGEKVMGFNGKHNIPVEVLELESPVRDHMYTLNFEDNSILKLTAEHPLYTTDGWKSLSPKATAKENSQLDVKQLKLGDKVLNSHGNFIKITDIDLKKRTIQTYNLKKVSDYNNFFANSFLAHNKGSPSGSYSKTYYINLTKQGVAVELERNDEVIFDFGNESHQTTAEEVKTSSLTLKIGDENYIFEIGDELTFDLNNDNKDDLSITLNKIEYSKATVIFKLYEEPESFLPSFPDTTEKDEKKEEKQEDKPKELGSAEIFREEIEDIQPETVGGASMFMGKINKALNSPYPKYVMIGIVILLIAIAIINNSEYISKIIDKNNKKTTKKNNSKKTDKNKKKPKKKRS